MPFPYYDHLSRRDQATYRKSDGIGSIRLPNAPAFGGLVGPIETALAGADRRALQKASHVLARGVTDALETAPVTVRVLARRPSSASEELHGLYTPADEKRAEIRVWMRTAAHGRVVRFRTFIRTLLHELCHHLDYELYELAESFHTEGFFRRESSLMRQLAPKRQAAPKRRTVEAPRSREHRRTVRSAAQLELPIAGRRRPPS